MAALGGFVQQSRQQGGAGGRKQQAVLRHICARAGTWGRGTGQLHSSSSLSTPMPKNVPLLEGSRDLAREGSQERSLATDGCH